MVPGLGCGGVWIKGDGAEVAFKEVVRALGAAARER